jgi:hypothetical protein
VLSAQGWVLGAGCFVLGMLTACSDLRVKESVFSNVDEARAGGAVAAGSVPHGLPESATDLRVGYLPDGRHWGVFTFAPTDAEAIRALLGSEISANPPACEPPGRLEWWPRLLHTPIDLDGLHATGFRLYAARAGQTTFAINWGQGRAYYWSG